MQLFIAYDKVVHKLKEGIKHTAADLLTAFTTHFLTEEEKRYISTKTALHLCAALVNWPFLGSLCAKQAQLSPVHQKMMPNEGIISFWTASKPGGWHGFMSDMLFTLQS